MGDYHGKGLEVIDLALTFHDGHWQVDRETTCGIGVKHDGTYAESIEIPPLVRTNTQARSPT